MENNKTTEQKKPTKKAEKVSIFIPYIEGQDPDVTVGINGTMYKIQKGVTVEVPRPVAKVIENSNHQARTTQVNREKFKNVEL